MITGTIRSPFKDNPHQNTEGIRKIVLQIEQEVDELLLHGKDFAPETHLKLSIEKRFLKIRAVYYRVFGQIL